MVQSLAFILHTEFDDRGDFTKDCRAHGGDQARVEVGCLCHGLDIAEGFGLKLVLRPVLAVVAEAEKGFTVSGSASWVWACRVQGRGSISGCNPCRQCRTWSRLLFRD
jgi:hypothetical protein